MRLQLVYVLLLLFASMAAGAQQITITGTVADPSGSPVSGATLSVKGGTATTATDAEGKFTLSGAASDGVLEITHVNFKPREEPINGRTIINITLEAAQGSMDEVVVVGYGTARKSDLTSAVSSISSKDFEKQPLYRVEDALQGRAAGVQVTKNSGAPGSEIKVRIRGSNSITGNNQPLVVIDGIIGADMRSINSNDIASFDILKDASATAIYGSRGANGVILITTKRGSGKPFINVDVFGTRSDIVKKIDLLSPEEFGAINNLTVQNGGTRYQDEYFRKGYTKNLQVSFGGKKDNVGYYVSGNLADQTGNVVNTKYGRQSLRSNFDMQLRKRLNAKVNLYGSSEKMLNLFNGGASSSNDDRAGIIAVLGWDPTLPLRKDDGSYNVTSSNGSTLINPLAQILESNAKTIINSANANINLSYDITDNLNFTTIGGLIYQAVFGESYIPIPSGTILTGPTAGGGSTNRANLQNSNILTWNKLFGKNNFKVTGLYEFQKFTSKSFSGSSGEYSIPGNFYTIDLGRVPNVGASLQKSEIQSWMARTEYNFDRRLYITASIRADISSRFRPGNQLGWFPSVSGAYQFTNLFNGAIDRLKLRAGYGETGNQGIEPYSTYNTLLTGQNYPLNGISETRGISLGNLGNPNLSWETTKQTNVGADFSIFDSRVNIAINKYWKNTVDLLLAVPIAGYLGGGTINQNVGAVFNGGWEADVDAGIVSSDNFNWSANLNYSYNQSEVKSLYEGTLRLLVSPVGISTAQGNYILLQEGQPLGQFYGATHLGTYKTGATDGTPGAAKYLRDANGGLVMGVLGNGIPKHTWGMGHTINWKNLDLNILIRGMAGFHVLNATRGDISLPSGTQTKATLGEFRNRWKADNPTDIPATGLYIANSSRFIEKGDFVRLSNMALGYTFENIRGFRSIRLYTSGQNLFTITKYKGYDPEVSSTLAGQGTGSSVDRGALPNPRAITFGLNVIF